MLTKFAAPLKKLALTLAILFLLFSGGLFYINKVFLPVQAKEIILKMARETLGRAVSFDTLQYSPLRGFLITRLSISDKDDPARTFLKAESASANVLWPALLKRKIVIPSIQIDKPEIWLTRNGANLWNFNDLIPAPTAATTTAAPAPIDLAITGLSINNGRVIVTDTTSGFSETFLIPLVQGSLSLPGDVAISGNIAIPSGAGRIEFNGRIALLDKSFHGTFKASNIVINRYLQLLPAPLPVNIPSLTLMDADMTLGFEKETLTVAGRLNLPGTDIALPDHTQLHGNIILSSINVRQDQNGLAVESTLRLEALAVDTPAGISLQLKDLRLARLKAAVNGDTLQASVALDAQEIIVALPDGQKFTADLKVRQLEFTQKGQAWTAHTEADAEGLSANLNNNCSLSAGISFKNTIISGNPETLKAQADIEANKVTVTMPEGTLTTHLLLPRTRLVMANGRLESAVRATFETLAVAAQGVTVKGKAELAAHLIMDPRATMPLTYTGMLRLTGLSADKVPAIGTISNIHSTFTFNTNRAQTKGLNLTAMATPWRISGELLDLAALRVNIKAVADTINLELAAKALPDIIKEYGLTISGTAQAEGSFNGSLAHPQDGIITASAVLTDVHAASSKLQQEISALNATLNYSAPSLFWKNLTVDYQGKTWTSRGYFQNFATPYIKASVKTDIFNADIEARKKDDTITLDAMDGAYFGSSFRIKGTILIPPGKSPQVDLISDIKLALRELPQMLPPEQAKQVEALKLGGTLKIKANVKGIAQEWQNLTSTLKVETPALNVMGYTIENLALNAAQKDSKISPLTLNGTLYGGKFETSTTLLLKEKDFPFETTIKAENIDLELLKKDTPLRQQQLSGLVTATAELKGACLDIRHITGKASLNVTKGYLWALEILSKILSLLSASFQGGDVVVTDATADFKILDAKVMTDNLTLKSAALTLSGEGWVDFDQNIDLNMSPNVTPGVAGVTLPQGLNPTADIVNIRIYNTLTAPKYEHNITAPKVLKKVVENTLGNLLKVFE